MNQWTERRQDETKRRDQRREEKTKETARAQRVRDCNEGQKELRKDHQKMKRQPQRSEMRQEDLKGARM